MQVLKKEYRDDLFLVNAINCESSQHAVLLERKIHSDWVEKRRFVKRANGTASNEWFALDEYDLIEIAKKYNAVIN